MNTTFDKEPTCELCGQKPAEEFVYTIHKEWKFSCYDCAEDCYIYPITVDRFFASPAATVDWIAHLSQKNWMQWDDFAKMIRRFRDATGSYHKIR